VKNFVLSIKSARTLLRFVAIESSTNEFSHLSENARIDFRKSVADSSFIEKCANASRVTA
jgi:hypothetical protein